MNAERLHNVLYDLDAEVDKRGVASLLSNFHSTYNQSITQPNPETSEAFVKARDALSKELNRSVANAFSPSQARILSTIKGEPYYGNGLYDALQAIIGDNVATPGQAVSQIQEHIKVTNEFHAAVKSAHTALDKLHLECEYTGKNEYEIGVLLPGKLFNNNIDDLGTELHLLNRHLKVFGEIAGTDTASPTIRNISNGSVELFLNALPEVAECLAEGIEYLVILYLSILQIKKHRKDLKEKEKVPEETLKPLEAHEKERVSQEIERIAKELFKTHRKKKEKDRDKELRGLLIHALKYIGKRIDQGADFEVTPPSEFEEISDDASDEQKEQAKQQRVAAKALLEKGKSITQLPERKQQVLSLPEPEKTPGDKDEPQQ